MKYIVKILAFIIFVPIFLACSEKLPSAADDVKPPHHGENQDPDAPELNILFIGNSFTMDAVTHLPGMLASADIKKVHMIHMYYGGRLVQQYNSGFSTSADYTAYECAPGVTSWTTSKGKTLEQVASSKEWDIVTIQEHTGSKFAWSWDNTAKNQFNQLMTKIKRTQKNTPKFYYILSQAYQDNAKIGSGSSPMITWTDHTGMWDVVADFAKNVMKDIPFDGIISTGAMLENLRTTSLNNDLGLTRDGYHMDNGLARYGASCAVFETLITPVYDVTLDSNKYRYTQSGSGTTPVTDSSAKVALEAARNAIKSPYTITDMSKY